MRAGLLLMMAVMVAVTLPGSMSASAQGDGRGWLALGDSYASGEGIPGTPAREAEGAGFATQGRDCRRATGEDTGATAWSVGAYREVARDLGFSQIALVACTGARFSELDAQIGEARARFGRSRWDLATFSIGGNDIFFAEVLEGCLDLNSVWGAFDLTPGCDISEPELRTRIDDLRGSLSGAYETVAKAVAPGGDVVVVGYPQLVEEVARWDYWRRNHLPSCEGIQSYDVGMLRSVAGYLNQQIALATQDADAEYRKEGIRFHFLDIAADPYEYSDKPTDRHSLCTRDPWLNGRTVGTWSGDWWERNRSFHPHQTGHTNTARVLADFLRDNVTFDDQPPINVDQLLTAPVPSLCEHPAGTLVDGELPGIPEMDGGVSVDLDLRPPVIADLDGDATEEIVAVFDCNRGGVGWPSSLLLYGPGLTLLDEFKLEELVDNGLPEYEGDRSGTRSLEVRDGQLHVGWLAHRAGDTGAGPTLPVDLILDVQNGQFAIVDVTRRDETPILEAVIAAANSGNRQGLDQYSLGPFVADDMLDAVGYGGAFTKFECTGSLDYLSKHWVQGEATRSCELTQADGFKAWAYFTYDYESTWTLHAFQAEVLFGE